MDKRPMRAYNILSWWFDIWMFLYVLGITTINPFVASVMTILWDLYGAFMLDIPKPTNQSIGNILVGHFRLVCIFLAHWVPLITLPPVIDYTSLGCLFGLIFLYVIFLFMQGITPRSVYTDKMISSENINSLEQLFTLRFHSLPIGFIGFGILFYTGIQLLMHPAKSSFLHKLY